MLRVRRSTAYREANALGGQAAGLGLSGEVSTDALEQLLTGCDPLTGVTLGNPLVDRATVNGTVIRAVAGFDATVSAPKSLSVWWALTGDEGLAECHDVAVAAVADYLQRFGSTTRIRSNGGRLHPDSEGLILSDLVRLVGERRLELPASCSQSRCATNCATPRRCLMLPAQPG